MGCGASVPEVDLATVDGGMTTSVPGLMAGVTTGRTGYFMKEGNSVMVSVAKVHRTRTAVSCEHCEHSFS